MRALSKWVRNWCLQWAMEHMRQGTNRAQSAVPLKNAHQELVRTLSIRVRNWREHWAYASVSYAYAQHKRKNFKFKKVPSKHAEHARKELMRAVSVGVRNWCVLCIRVRNWCARSACASEIKWCLAPQKSIFLTPKSPIQKGFMV